MHGLENHRNDCMLATPRRNPMVEAKRLPMSNRFTRAAAMHTTHVAGLPNHDWVRRKHLDLSLRTDARIHVPGNQITDTCPAPHLFSAHFKPNAQSRC